MLYDYACVLASQAGTARRAGRQHLPWPTAIGRVYVVHVDDAVSGTCASPASLEGRYCCPPQCIYSCGRITDCRCLPPHRPLQAQFDPSMRARAAGGDYIVDTKLARVLRKAVLQ